MNVSRFMIAKLSARGVSIAAGVLVAVAVLDVLPRCLSSKYVFWDPDLAHLSLGKLTALREIAWVQAAARACPRLHYYYQVPLPAHNVDGSTSRRPGACPCCMQALCASPALHECQLSC